MNQWFLAGGLVGGVMGLTGCSVIPSTTNRALVTGVGAAAGGVAGYGLGDKKPGWTIAGAGIGALASGLALGKDPAVEQSSFDDGYVQGQADAIKRQYFLRQALEAQSASDASSEGTTVHYLVPGPTVTVDGRKLEPHTVTLDVVE